MDDNKDVISNIVDYINELKKTYKPHLKVPNAGRHIMGKLFLL